MRLSAKLAAVAATGVNPLGSALTPTWASMPKPNWLPCGPGASSTPTEHVRPDPHLGVALPVLVSVEVGACRILRPQRCPFPVSSLATKSRFTQRNAARRARGAPHVPELADCDLTRRGLPPRWIATNDRMAKEFTARLSPPGPTSGTRLAGCQCGACAAPPARRSLELLPTRSACQAAKRNLSSAAPRPARLMATRCPEQAVDAQTQPGWHR